MSTISDPTLPFSYMSVCFSLIRPHNIHSILSWFIQKFQHMDKSQS